MGRFRFLPGVALTKLLASVVATLWGFRAISDDDYSRVVIAQQFAMHPSWDPSGTSWLPAPFWLWGSAMSLFGGELVVARAFAWLSSALSALLVYPAARFMGLGRRASILAALMSAILPHAVWLGMATVPDGLVATLLLVAAASTASNSARHRLLAGLGLLTATLSRYEAWPLAALFMAFTGWDLLRHRIDGRRAEAWFATVLAGIGPVAWLVHGQLDHGSATFFIKRVVEYQASVHGALDPSVYLKLLFRAEPELWCTVALVTLLSRKTESSPVGRYRRPLWFAVTLLAFLTIGAARGGAPTHHLERPLLAIWLGLTVFLGDVMDQLLAKLGSRPLSAPLLGLIVAGGTLRYFWPVHEGFVDRRAEEDMGRVTRSLVLAKAAPTSSLVRLDTADYGYFAVQAASGQPWKFTRDAAGTPTTRFLITDASHQLGPLAAHGELLFQTGSLMLLDLGGLPPVSARP